LFFLLILRHGKFSPRRRPGFRGVADGDGDDHHGPGGDTIQHQAELAVLCNFIRHFRAASLGHGAEAVTVGGVESILEERKIRLGV
jgi:hypothetical protein